MGNTKTALVDLSAIFWRMYHASEGDEVSSAKRKTLGFVRDKFAGFDNVKVCVDCPPYARKELYPAYKANRPERPPMLVEELEQTKKALFEDGWSVLTCPGAEADDIIGTYCAKKEETEEVTIFGTDKDLLQIMGVVDGVRLYDQFNSRYKTSEEVFGVAPNKVIDVLALSGDKSDNIPGVPGVGDITAAKLIDEFGSVDGVISALDDLKDSKCEKFPIRFKTEKFYNKVLSAKDDILLSYQLASLNYNCEICETKKEVADVKEEDNFQEEDKNEEPEPKTQEIATVATVADEPQRIVSTEPLAYSKSLEPVGLPELWKVSNYLLNSGLYGSFRNANGIMAAIMAGRELGFGATTSLAGISIIKGKPCVSPQSMLAMCLSNSKCEYFDCIETTEKIATFATKRAGRKEFQLSFTIEEAEEMGLLRKSQSGSPTQWDKMPAVMLRWRCIAAVARLVYPDVINGTYTPEEMGKT